MWERVCNAIVRSGAVTLYVTSEEKKTASLARILNAAIVKNGVDVLATLPDCEWLLTSGIRLFFMGWIAPQKGIENFQQAMNPSDGPTITLFLCGTGDKKYASSL